MNDALPIALSAAVPQTAKYQYRWRDQYYRRTCEIIEHVNSTRCKVRFVDTGEVAVIKQMALRMIRTA